MMNTWHQGAYELLVVFITVGSHYGGLGDQITCYGACAMWQRRLCRNLMLLTNSDHFPIRGKRKQKKLVFSLEIHGMF